MRKKQTLTFKMVLYVLLTILPVNFFLIYLATTARKISYSTAHSSMENVARVYVEQAERRMENINSFIWSLEDADQNLKTIGEETDRDRYYIAAMGLRQTMNTHMLSYKDADGYFFYSELTEEGMALENAQQLSSTEFRDAVLADRELWADSRWKILNVGETRWLLHANQWKQVLIGAGILLDEITAAMEDAIAYENARVYFSETETPETDENEYDHVTVQCGRRNLFLHVDVDHNEIVLQLPLLQKIAYFLSFAWLLLIPLIIWIMNWHVLRPLRVINRAILTIRQDPSTRIEESANTEDFEQVNRSFNTMADQIVSLKIDNYERELQRQKLELRNLRLQIKPHFLFNSLNLMYNLVQMGETQSVQQMLLYLSDYFRYINVGDHDFSILREEVDLIRKYLEVAQIRYPGLIDASVDVTEEALDAQVPQLMIHNFVENIVKHGLDLSRVNHIQLRAWKEASDLIVEIEDDGVGMSAAQAERISQGVFEYEDGKRHLGMKNSYRRLQFYYGNRGSFLIDSKEQQGTRVTLRFPADADGTSNDREEK